MLPQDANAFLDACERDRVAILGWELWLIEHQGDGRDGANGVTGEWTGLIPATNGGTCVWTGDGDAAATRQKIATLDWEKGIPPQLHPHIRFNFTLDL